MRVLMLGWEFPPFKSGGLGTACRDLTKGLLSIGVQVTFVMPVAPGKSEVAGVKIIGTNNYTKNIKIRKVDTILTPYMNSESYAEQYLLQKKGMTSSANIYGPDLYNEVLRYTAAVEEIAKEEEFDVIHAHDWMTYKAGMAAKNISGKPLVVHMHATEFDRTGGNPNQFISHTEWEGMMAADRVVTISNYMKQNVMEHYLIPEWKIRVAHWGIENGEMKKYNVAKHGKTVLFLGRITIQKGPDYFVEAAKKVLEYEPDTLFVMAGNGDMFPRMVNRSIELGISKNMLFTGFLSGEDVYKAYQMADVYVMPSVSEPFGLVALEALKNNTPVIMSKTSGVSEVVQNALKVDFWDTEEMANKIIGVLRYAPLKEELRQNGYEEVGKMNLVDTATKVLSAYNEVAG